LLVVNKWDLAREMFRRKKKMGDTEIIDDRELMEKYREYLNEELQYLDYAPMVFTTAKEGKNVQTAVDAAQHLFNQSCQRMTTGQLNRAVRQVLQDRAPSTAVGRKAKVYFAAHPPAAQCPHPETRRSACRPVAR
jgi:GTP-binding protein